MEQPIDFFIATPEQIEKALCHQVRSHRLALNLTQAELATRAGITHRTLSRMETGEKVSFTTFIRVMVALGLQSQLQILLPSMDIRPIERIVSAGAERKRVRTKSTTTKTGQWTWGDEK